MFLQSFFVFGQNWHNVFYLRSVNVDFVVLFFVGQNWHSVFCLWSVLPGVVFFPLQSHLDLVMRIGVLLFVDVFFCSWFCGDGKWPSTFSHHPACNNLCNRPERHRENTEEEPEKTARTQRVHNTCCHITRSRWWSSWQTCSWQANSWSRKWIWHKEEKASVAPI